MFTTHGDVPHKGDNGRLTLILCNKSPPQPQPPPSQPPLTHADWPRTEPGHSHREVMLIIKTLRMSYEASKNEYQDNLGVKSAGA